MADPAPLASLSVTHVYYVRPTLLSLPSSLSPSLVPICAPANGNIAQQDPDDKLSLFCAYLALLPQALCVVYATLIWSTREAEIALTFAGQLACEALNFALKRLIKEERPLRIHGKGYGMPSSHAQFVAFWSVSLALFVLVRHAPPRVSPAALAERSHMNRPWSLGERAAVSVAGFAVAGLIAWSRIYLNYHTVRQVLAGAGTGVVFAVVWYVAVGVARSGGWLTWALEIPLARAMRMRDLLVEEDPCQAGWEKWEEKKRTKTKTAGGSKAKTK